MSLFNSKKKKECSSLECLNFLIAITKNLSLSYDKQKDNIPEFAQWNLPDDIANQWEWEYLKYFTNRLTVENAIGQEIIDITKKICEKFLNVSFGQPFYNEKIWTHYSMQNHPFWDEQRQLAKKLLTELEKIQL